MFSIKNLITRTLLVSKLCFFVGSGLDCGAFVWIHVIQTESSLGECGNHSITPTTRSSCGYDLVPFVVDETFTT